MENNPFTTVAHTLQAPYIALLDMHWQVVAAADGGYPLLLEGKRSAGKPIIDCCEPFALPLLLQTLHGNPLPQGKLHQEGSHLFRFDIQPTAAGHKLAVQYFEATGSGDVHTQLANLQHKFDTIFSHVPVSILVTRRSDGIIHEANDRFLALTGFKREEVIGKPANGLGIWKDLKRYQELQQKIAKLDHVRKERIIMANKMGEQLTVHVYGGTLELNGEACDLKILNNVTDHVNAEKIISDSEARFKGIFQHAGIGIVMTNSLGSMMEVNGFMMEILGYSKEELLGKTLFSLMPGDFRRSEKQRFLALLKGKEAAATKEIALLHKNGIEKDVRLTITFVQGGHLEPTYSIAMLEDITAQKQAAAAATESQDMLRAINNNISDGIFRSVLERGLVYANEAFVRLFGFDSYEQMRDIPTHELYKDPTQPQQLLTKLKQQGFLHQEEVVLKRRDGSLFWALFTCSITVKHEGLTYFDGAIIDITELKRTQHLLRAQNEELEKINKELDRFVYSASHDLRAPLTSLLGLLELIEMYSSDAEIAPYLGMMRKSINKLDLFIRDIVNYSRNARTEVAAEQIDFHAIIHDTFEHLAYMEGAKRIRRKIEIEGDAAFYTDPTRLGHILSNLVSNAIKYHRFHQPDPYIAIFVDIKPNKTIIRVADNGQGIVEQHQSRVFEMFYRASEEAKGSGLGLYIVKEAIDKLGGKISLQSKVNQGSTFTVELPNLQDFE